MIEVKLLGRVKYQNTLYVADDVITIDESTAEYLKEKNLCEVLAVLNEAKDKPTKKSKKVKQESK